MNPTLMPTTIRIVIICTIANGKFIVSLNVKFQVVLLHCYMYVFGH